MDWLKFIIIMQYIAFLDGFDFGVGTVRCYFNLGECCNDYYIPHDFSKLNYDLRTKLYGQDIVIENLIPAIKSHFDGEPKKALVISMHGWTGGGKNYVTQTLIESLYREGRASSFVHYFSKGLDFPLESKVDQYMEALHNWIKGNLTLCPRSTFIFDETDKMNPRLLEAVKPFFDFQSPFSLRINQAIFIFISNIGGSLITQKYLQLWEDGFNREKMKYKDFEPILRDALYYNKGGFEQSTILESHLVSLFLPFLPLEKEHIRLCMKSEIQRKSIGYVSDEEIESLVNEMEYYKDRFSTSGCKRVHDLVAPLKYRIMDEF